MTQKTGNTTRVTDTTELLADFQAVARAIAGELGSEASVAITDGYVKAVILAKGWTEPVFSEDTLAAREVELTVTMLIDDFRFDSVEVLVETQKNIKRDEVSLAMLAAEGSRPIQRLCGRMGIECNA
jgi:hypothetical protein